MKSKKKTLFNKRQFLNKKEGLAAINGAVKIVESDVSIEVDAQLTISDCSRQIYLDFECWDTNSLSDLGINNIKQLRAKVKTLREHVNNFLDAVEAGYDELEAKAPEKKVKRKEQDAERLAIMEALEDE